jgi:hypothetical protein
MIKTITAWTMIVASTALILDVVLLIAGFVQDNIKDRKAGDITKPVFSMPDFMGISLETPIKTPVFMTDTKVMLIGQLGIALLLLATGSHLIHLRRQELGAEQLRKAGLIAEPGGRGYGSPEAGSPSPHR